MQPGNKRWLAAAAVVATGVWLGWSRTGLAPVPVPGRAQVRAMLPAITAYLQAPAYRDHNGGYQPAAYQSRRVIWLCDAAIIEIRPAGGQWRAGMDVSCGDYGRRGGKVVQEDGGDNGREVMTLTRDHGRYQVLSAAQEPGVSPDPSWIDRNFSAPAAAQINNGTRPMAPMPDSRALRAFGCRPGTRHGRLIQNSQGDAWGWPCVPTSPPGRRA